MLITLIDITFITTIYCPSHDLSKIQEKHCCNRLVREELSAKTGGWIVAAMSPVSQGGGEAPVSAEAPPWQGGLLSDDACRGVMQ